VIPVFISLPLFADLLKEPSTRDSLMHKAFGKLFNVDSTLVDGERFLFIFDGLDELGFHFNLFDECNLQPWASHSVFVVTSRLGFLSEASARSRLMRVEHAGCFRRMWPSASRRT
jgi:hypothetical protein